MSLSLLLITLSLYNLIACHYHMSSTGMRDLIKLERELSNSFLNYYQEELKRINELESFLNDAFNQSEYREEDYLKNPLNGYKLIKRFAKQWLRYQRFHRPRFTAAIMHNYSIVYHSVQGFKDKTELRGSVFAIMKLQETYTMNASTFIQLFNNRYSQKLMLHDIFIIGYYAMSLEYYAISKLWLEEAYNLYHTGEDKDLYPYNFTRLVESLVWSADRIDDFETAGYYAQRLFELHPNSRIVQEKLDYYKYRSYWMKRSQGPMKKTIEEKLAYKDYNGRTWLKREYKMCRGEETMRQRDINKLSCTYYRPNYEFYLKPIELEVAYDKPKILYFHNLLSPDEVDEIIEKARKKLSTAEVFHFNTGQLITADYRISKSAWFSAWYHSLIRKLMLRVGRVVNLNMRYTEPLQVANYGIGGNYESHYDHAIPPQNSSIFGKYNWGNRVATMLIYLSDVETGGHTVFTNTGPGVAVPPKKGAGVFWYNLKRTGESDYRTKHAGCPVLRGEKWVANLWIHEWGQEFIRQCPLNP